MNSRPIVLRDLCNCFWRRTTIECIEEFTRNDLRFPVVKCIVPRFHKQPGCPHLAMFLASVDLICSTGQVCEQADASFLSHFASRVLFPHTTCLNLGIGERVVIRSGPHGLTACSRADQMFECPLARNNYPRGSC